MRPRWYRATARATTNVCIVIEQVDTILTTVQITSDLYLKGKISKLRKFGGPKMKILCPRCRGTTIIQRFSRTEMAGDPCDRCLDGTIECEHDGETYRTDYTDARKLTRVTKCAQCDETIGVDEYRLTSAVHRILVEWKTSNQQPVPPYVKPPDPWPEGWEMPSPGPCNGICITASDIGLPEYGSQVAYGHPDCELHGDGKTDPQGDCWYRLEVSKPDGGWHVYLYPSHSYAHIRDEAEAWDALNYFSDYYSDGPAKFRLVRCWEESEVIR